MNNTYKLGSNNHLLSLNIDFTKEIPIMNIEMFNPHSRTESNWICELTNMEIEKRSGDAEYATINGNPFMRVHTRNEGLAINIESIIRQLDVNKI